MKLLIAHRNIDSGPHFFSEHHLSEVKKCAPDWEVLASSDPELIAKESIDAQAIAGFPATIPIIKEGTPIRWVHSFSAGVDRVLTPHVMKSDIMVSNSSGIHATPISEHVLGFLLMWVRRSIPAYRNQEQKIWQKDECVTELRGKTVLVVGMGKIGSEVARLAQAFGCHVTAVVRRKREKPLFVNQLFEAQHIDTVLPEADFVCICLPGGEKTRHFFNAQKFALMKKSAVVINIGRGTIVKQDDLVNALSDGLIGGAMLDVTEPEPLPPSSPLWDMENVVITPHHSGLSQRYMDRATSQLCHNLEAFRAGEPLPNAVDKSLGY
jgi:D-2-hydroxyacid dehydrogenase (NADP+)